MAEIDDVRAAIDRASQSGDLATVQRLSTRYRDLQAASGALAPVGNFRAQTGREFQLASRALTARRAGREADAVGLIRLISRERVARESRANNITNDTQAFNLGLNHSLFNVGNIVPAAGELIEDTLGGNRNGRTAAQSSQDLALTEEQIRHDHPVSSTAGEATGIVATLPAAEAAVGRLASGVRAVPGVARLAPVARASEIGAEARAAQLAARGGRAGQVARGGARAAVTGAAYGGAYGGADAAETGRDIVQGATEGAEIGAVGGVALRGAGEVVAPVLGALGERLLQSSAVQQIARRLQEPAQNVVARMVEFQQRMGRLPSAAEILGERGGREVASAISGHGNAIETAINHSTEVQTRRSGDLAEAVTGGRPAVAAADVNAAASNAHTETMNRIGDHAVNLTDDQLAFLTGRDARRLFRGSLTDVGNELRGHVAAREAAATARTAFQEAAQNASQLAQRVASERARVPTIASAAERVRAKQALPALERQAQRAADLARDARARATTAASEVRPAQITLRNIEDLRHSASNAAGDGAMYFMNDVADQIRGIAQGAGRPGAEYENSIRQLAAGKAQSEGVAAGRSVVSSGGKVEPLAAARATGKGPEQVAATRRGARQGVYTQLGEEAGQGPRGMRTTADELALNPTLRAGLEQTVGPAEAGRLAETGRVAGDAARSLEAATPRHSQSLAEEAANQTQSWTNAAVVLSGHTGGAFKARFAQQVLSRLSISPQAANHLAELAFNPARVGEFVSLLARYSGSARRLQATMEHLAGFLPAQAARAQADAKTRATNEQAGAEPRNQQTPEPVQVGDVSDAYLSKLAQVESSGDPNARAETSSATGLHQFTDGTWLATIRDHGAEVGLERLAQHIRANGSVDDPAIRAQILELRRDPEISTNVARAFTAVNLNALEQDLGREPSAGELYAAHFLGLGGAKRLIHLAESGNANAAQEFPREARANRSIFYNNGRARSAREVIDELESKWA